MCPGHEKNRFIKIQAENFSDVNMEKFLMRKISMVSCSSGHCSMSASASASAASVAAETEILFLYYENFFDACKCTISQRTPLLVTRYKNPFRFEKLHQNCFSS